MACSSFIPAPSPEIAPSFPCWNPWGSDRGAKIRHGKHRVDQLLLSGIACIARALDPGPHASMTKRNPDKAIAGDFVRLAAPVLKGLLWQKSVAAERRSPPQPVVKHLVSARKIGGISQCHTACSAEHYRSSSFCYFTATPRGRSNHFSCYHARSPIVGGRQLKRAANFSAAYRKVCWLKKLKHRTAGSSLYKTINPMLRSGIWIANERPRSRISQLRVTRTNKSSYVFRRLRGPLRPICLLILEYEAVITI